MKTLAIYGAGGLGREVLELARQISEKSKKWDEYVFVDDAEISSLNTVPVIRFDGLSELYEKDQIEVTVAIGEPSIREVLLIKVSNAGYTLATLIHPLVHIPRSTVIADGVTICSGCFISSDATIRSNVYIQPNVMLGHDCTIEKNTVVGPSVSIAGGCCIGQRSYIGMGTLIKEQVKVGSNVILSMGSVVYKDITDDVIAVGNPARIVKKNEENKVFGHE